jgi:hypothetical protein
VGVGVGGTGVVTQPARIDAASTATQPLDLRRKTARADAHVLELNRAL